CALDRALRNQLLRHSHRTDDFRGDQATPNRAAAYLCRSDLRDSPEGDGVASGERSRVVHRQTGDGPFPFPRVLALAVVPDRGRALSTAVLRVVFQNGRDRPCVRRDPRELVLKQRYPVQQSKRPRHRAAADRISDRDERALADAPSSRIWNGRLFIRAVSLSRSVPPIADPFFPADLDRRSVVDAFPGRISGRADGSRDLMARVRVSRAEVPEFLRDQAPAGRTARCRPGRERQIQGPYG